MPPKKHAKKQRVRLTNKAIEGLRFSTVRVPAKSEVQKQEADIDRLISDHRNQTYSGGGEACVSGQDNAKAPGSARGKTRLSSSAVFDPIPNDPMFTVVEKSKYWPPPSLEELHKSAGIELTGDGFDSYDRREDDEKARQARAKIVRGELNHPRGKPRQNVLVKLESDSDDDSGG